MKKIFTSLMLCIIGGLVAFAAPKTYQLVTDLSEITSNPEQDFVMVSVYNGKLYGVTTVAKKFTASEIEAASELPTSFTTETVLSPIQVKASGTDHYILYDVNGGQYVAGKKSTDFEIAATNTGADYYQFSISWADETSKTLKIASKPETYKRYVQFSSGITVGHYASQSASTYTMPAFYKELKDDRMEANLAFNPSNYDVNIKEVSTITLNLTKDTDAAVEYSSDNDVVSVDENGIVTINSIGKATITAKTASNDVYQAGFATCVINVFDPDAIVEDIVDESFADFTTTYKEYTYESDYASIVMFGYKNSGIQWNTNSQAKSGMYINAKEGYKAVSVTVESNYKKTINVYSNDEAYTDLSGISSTTELKTLTSELTSYTFADGVKYFALRPAETGAVIITKITIVWAKEAVNEPLAHPVVELEGYEEGADYDIKGKSVTVTLSHDGEGVTIFHKWVPAKAPVLAAAEDADYTGYEEHTPFTVTEPGTLYYYAARGDEKTEPKYITFVDSTTGIDAIEADSNEAVEYFNLQGIRISRPEAGNIYIRKQGTKVSKVML